MKDIKNKYLEDTHIKNKYLEDTLPSGARGVETIISGINLHSRQVHAIIDGMKGVITRLEKGLGEANRFQPNERMKAHLIEIQKALKDAKDDLNTLSDSDFRKKHSINDKILFGEEMSK